MRIDRIKFVTALARRDMSLKKLGTITGLSRATLSGVKCGKTCAPDTARRIAVALNAPIEQLVEKEAK